MYTSSNNYCLNSNSFSNSNSNNSDNNNNNNNNNNENNNHSYNNNNNNSNNNNNNNNRQIMFTKVINFSTFLFIMWIICYNNILQTNLTYRKSNHSSNFVERYRQSVLIHLTN